MNAHMNSLHTSPGPSPRPGPPECCQDGFHLPEFHRGIHLSQSAWRCSPEGLRNHTGNALLEPESRSLCHNTYSNAIYLSHFSFSTKTNGLPQNYQHMKPVGFPSHTLWLLALLELWFLFFILFHSCFLYKRI